LAETGDQDRAAATGWGGLIQAVSRNCRPTRRPRGKLLSGRSLDRCFDEGAFRWKPLRWRPSPFEFSPSGILKRIVTNVNQIAEVSVAVWRAGRTWISTGPRSESTGKGELRTSQSAGNSRLDTESRIAVGLEMPLSRCLCSQLDHRPNWESNSRSIPIIGVLALGVFVYTFYQKPWGTNGMDLLLSHHSLR
jgi:hypothetical protein